MAIDFLNDAYTFSKSTNKLYKLSKDGSVEDLSVSSGGKFEVKTTYNYDIIKTLVTYANQAKYLFTLTTTTDPSGTGNLTASTQQSALLSRYETGNGTVKRMLVNYKPITMCMDSTENILYILTSHIQKASTPVQKGTSGEFAFPTASITRINITDSGISTTDGTGSGGDEFPIDISTKNLTVDDMIFDSNDVCYVISKNFKRLYISIDNLKTFYYEALPAKPVKFICDHSNTLYILCEDKTVRRVVNKKVTSIVVSLPTNFSINNYSSIVALSTGKLYVSGQLNNKGCLIPVLNNTTQDPISINSGLITDIAINKQDNIVVLTNNGTFYILSTKTDSLSSAYSVGGSSGILVGGIDMTACNSYNIYNVPIKSMANYPEGGWPIDTMDSEIQSILTEVRDGNIRTRANLVTFNDIYPTVEDALKSILGITPFVVKFTANTSTGLYEVGEEITSVDVSWVFNRAVKHAYIRYIDISDNVTEIADLATQVPLANGAVPISGYVKLAISRPITTSGKFYLYVTDGTTIVSSTNYAVISIKFVHRILFGSITEAQRRSINSFNRIQWQSLFNTLDRSILMSSPYDKYFKISCGTNENSKKIPVVAVPKEWGVTTNQLTFANGYLSTWSKSTTTYINDSDEETQYDVFYFDYGLNGDLLLNILDIIEVE